MNVLVACEESQTVCKAFRKLGHNAFSCDLLKCSGGCPEWHIRADVLDILHPTLVFKIPGFITEDGTYHRIEKWDLIIAHPPCTYLSNAGARWLYAGGILNEERYQKGLEGKEFFMQFLFADCDKICIENPTPSKIYNLPKCTQVIQPYQFGDPWSKRTCLWLKGLPPLEPTDICKEFRPYCSSGSYSKYHDDYSKGASRKGGAAKSRAKFFPGVARAMAEQWGGIINE